MKLEMRYHLIKSTNGAEVCQSSKLDDDVSVEIGGSDSSYVICPVCGNAVQGSDHEFSFRFGEEVDLRKGHTISFVRDQYNVKDPSAIKILEVKKLLVTTSGSWLGPWFRVTNISYQEVTDPQQAIEGLCARCYGCSFESLKEPDGYI
ncbi:hypothetical protein C5167_040317 [Papaver somniferum]|uniref:Uncharacterized protein n=1 Tax=Papaver somniferum TaxID=3469 RepID=A0A4Y7IIT4_PAPSO|nr:hypothetical protein C5167_040317 [Papaver somniferum]